MLDWRKELTGQLEPEMRMNVAFIGKVWRDRQWLLVLLSVFTGCGTKTSVPDQAPPTVVKVTRDPSRIDLRGIDLRDVAIACRATITY